MKVKDYFSQIDRKDSFKLNLDRFYKHFIVIVFRYSVFISFEGEKERPFKAESEVLS